MRISSFLVLALLAACGGTVATAPESSQAKVPDAQPSPSPSPAGDAAPGPAKDASTGRPDANRDASGADGSGANVDPACAVDADCEEPGATGLGLCWQDPVSKGTSCLCKTNAYKQPSGKCAQLAPSADCGATGGVCTSWAACSGAGNVRSLATSCGGGDQACCVSTCKTTAVTGCYVRGSDAAYVPVCIGGFRTCLPGDIPDIEIR